MAPIFDGQAWYTTLDEHRAAVLALRGLVMDDDAVTSHLENTSKKFRQDAENDAGVKRVYELAAQLGSLDAFTQLHLFDIHEAYKILSRQSIVIVVAFVEEILKEFFYCTFCKYPERMYDYLSPNSDRLTKGKVDLNQITKAQSKEHLIRTLASRSSAVAIQGKFTTITSNLLKVTKNKVDTELLAQLTKLIEQRNRIVHELSKENVSDGDVENAFDLAFKFIEHLEKIAPDMGIMVLGPPE